METKDIKINCPEGFEIDKENSTFECIKFKRVMKGLPKTWEEFCKTHPNIEDEYYITPSSAISIYSSTIRNERGNRNLLPSKELAEAMLALCQLIQLRDCYNDGWKPVIGITSNRYSISIVDNAVSKICGMWTNFILTFKTAELRDEFLENFKDLIEIAKPLL